MTRLREARLASGLTQAGIAKMIACSRPLVTKAETGEAPLSSDLLEKMSEIYNLPVNFLKGKEGLSMSDSLETGCLKKMILANEELGEDCYGALAGAGFAVGREAVIIKGFVKVDLAGLGLNELELFSGVLDMLLKARSANFLKKVA